MNSEVSLCLDSDRTELGLLRIRSESNESNRNPIGLVGEYKVLEQWSKLLTKSAITREDYAKDPQAVLEFYTDRQKRELENLSLGESSIFFMYRFL